MAAMRHGHVQVAVKDIANPALKTEIVLTDCFYSSCSILAHTVQ